MPLPKYTFTASQVNGIVIDCYFTDVWHSTHVRYQGHDIEPGEWDASWEPDNNVIASDWRYWN